MRHELLATLPNRITSLRLASVPLLWILAILQETAWLGIGVAIAALTDVLDGAIARWSGHTTAFGSRLDSIADHLLTLSTALWLVMLRPEFFVRERVPLVAWALVAAAAILVGWLRFRRVGGLHLYSAKIAGTAGYLFAIWLLTTGSYAPPVFHAALGLAFLAAFETLLVFLTARQVDERIGSIVLLRRRGSPPSARHPAGSRTDRTPPESRRA
jgi:phosphatidylglycerophosphate synthase